MSAVWDRTTEFLSDNIGPVAAIAGLALFIPNAAQGVLQPYAETVGPLPKLGLALVSLALTVLGIWGQAALVALALEPTLDGSGAFARGRSRLGAMIGVSMVVVAAVVLLAVPPLVLMAVDGVDLTALSDGIAPNMSPGIALLLALYVLILVPVLLWVSARLMPLSAVVVAERRGVGAIGRAFGLTKGLAARLVGVAILFLVVVGVAVLATKTVVGSIMRIAFGDNGPLDAASIVTALAVAVVSTIMTALALAFVAKLYQACVARAEVAPAA